MARFADRYALIVLVAVIIISAFCAAECGDISEAHAQGLPAPIAQLDEITLHTLALGVSLETASAADQSEMMFVLARRWASQRRGWSLAEQARRYVQPLRNGPKSPRQYALFALYAGKSPDTAAMRLVHRWARGLVPPVCDGAQHWAARSLRSPLKLAWCRRRLANGFYLAPDTRED